MHNVQIFFIFFQLVRVLSNSIPETAWGRRVVLGDFFIDIGTKRWYINRMENCIHPAKNLNARDPCFVAYPKD
jgi:hypothetical protein